MHTPSKSLLIKIAISVAIVSAILTVIKKTRTPKSSLIPAKEGFQGDGLPEYADVEYSVRN